MKVQRVRYPDSRISWTVIGDDYLPIKPIQQYLKYLESLEKSPNTISAYARHLKLYWEFLSNGQIDWKDIASKLEKFAEFIPWLRQPNPKVVSLQPQESRRTERTINTILAAIYSFYNFHNRRGVIKDFQLYGSSSYRGSPNYKEFLYHITKGNPVPTKLIKLKEPKIAIKTFTKEQVKALIDVCAHLRDKLLLTLLYETGMRIGEALGLRHEDFKPWDNEIHIVYRSDNANRARSKNMNCRKIDVSIELMSLYSDYFMYEYPEDLITDYVFVNIWAGRIGHPITYSTVSDLFEQLRAKTGIASAHPHMMRHTHATELLKSGWDASYVRDRLGHTNVQTTINTYAHLENKDLKQAYQEFLAKKAESQG